MPYFVPRIVALVQMYPLRAKRWFSITLGQCFSFVSGWLALMFCKGLSEGLCKCARTTPSAKRRSLPTQTRRIPELSCTALLSSLLVAVSCANSLYAQVGSKSENELRSADAFKNVSALAEMPANQMGKVMNIMSASLGVNCQFCHDGYDFAKENVAHKDVARKMIEMTFELNRKYFEGEAKVTCVTCHRGQTHAEATLLMGPLPEPKTVEQPARIPTVEEVLAKAVEALGGQERLTSIVSRRTVAKRIEPDGRSEPEELWQSSDGQHRVVTTYKSAVVTEWFDGKRAFKKANDAEIQLKVDEALQIEREAQLALGLNLKAAFDQLQFKQLEQIGDRRAFVLESIGSKRITERLYFDEQSGLLARRTSTVPTVLGDFAYQVDYEDYRAFDGIQLPSKLRFAVPNITWTREVISVEHQFR